MGDQKEQLDQGSGLYGALAGAWSYATTSISRYSALENPPVYRRQEELFKFLWIRSDLIDVALEKIVGGNSQGFAFICESAGLRREAPTAAGCCLGVLGRWGKFCMQLLHREVNGHF